MRIEIPMLPPKEANLNWSLRLPTSDETGFASLIDFLCGRSTTIYANALGLLGSMFSPKSSLTGRGAKLPSRFIERPGASEGASAILTLQFNCFMSMQAFKRAVDLFCSQPVRCPVNFPSTICADLKQPATSRSNLASSGTIYLSLFLPRRVRPKFFAASGAFLSGEIQEIEAVDTEFSSWFFISAKDVGNNLYYLRIIIPNYSCTSIQNQFGQIIKVSTLLVALIKKNTYTESIVCIRQKCLVGTFNLPSNPFFSFSCLAWCIRPPIFIDSKSWSLFGYWFAFNNHMNSDAGFRYPFRPCQDIWLKTIHIVIISHYCN